MSISAEDRVAPSLDDMLELAEQAWRAMPTAFRQMAGDVVFKIEDFADAEILADLGLEDPFQLTGVYSGVDLTRRSLSDPTPQTPRSHP